MKVSLFARFIIGATFFSICTLANAQLPEEETILPCGAGFPVAIFHSILPMSDPIIDPLNCPTEDMTLTMQDHRSNTIRECGIALMSGNYGPLPAQLDIVVQSDPHVTITLAGFLCEDEHIVLCCRDAWPGM